VTFIPPFDNVTPRPRLSRHLDPTELRILGSLIEKQLSTPEYYPLTLNALLAACNQKSNREPVMELSESDVQKALERLQDEKLVWKVMGGRAVRYDQNLDTAWHLKRREKALLALLMLRGPQTAGELRGRSDRLEKFDTVAEVEELLRDLASEREPLVQELPRRPGQKEQRWAHTTGGAVVDLPIEAEPVTGQPLSTRVQQLEERVEALAAELASLKRKLGE
jgi:uncharacterized protein YceH (UPF0502 family)